MDVGALIRFAAEAPSLLVATDFDGTISEIATNPVEAHPSRGSLEALSALAQTNDTAVAVISGRTQTSLRAQTARLAGAWRGSEHGSFLETPDGLSLALAPPPSEATLAALIDAAHAVAAKLTGVRVERKLTGISMHVREVSREILAGAAPVLDAFRAEAARQGFAILEGRQVLEARSPDHTKATALATLLGRLPAATLPLFAGDDRTDDAAILLAHDRGGAGVFVASTERPAPPPGADVVFASPAAWTEALAAIAARRAHRGARPSQA